MKIFSPASVGLFFNRKLLNSIISVNKLLYAKTQRATPTPHFTSLNKTGT